YEDVSIFDQIVVAVIDAVRVCPANTVRLPVYQNGQRFGVARWRKDKGVQARAVARLNHLLAPFKRNERLDDRFVAYAPGGIVYAVLPPDETGDFTFGIADESRLG